MTNTDRIVIAYPAAAPTSLRIDTFHDAFVDAVRNGGAICNDLADTFTVRVVKKANGETWGFVEFA